MEDIDFIFLHADTLALPNSVQTTLARLKVSLGMVEKSLDAVQLSGEGVTYPSDYIFTLLKDV